MILARWALAIGLSCAALPALDARADVLEIDADGARWVTGAGRAQPAAPDESMTLGTAEVPGDIVVPDIAVADPGRHARLVPQDYRAKVAEVAGRFDLSPTLIEALVWQESRWRANAVSPVGARGLAQLMPGTASDLGVDPDDPFANLEGGARYLREQLDRFDGDLEKALAAYNAGPGRVIRAGGVPRIRETQLYVAAIMGRLSDHSRE
ncbi:MAG: lytic transglycosylase domain-containing protein [Qipengyuania citrea]